MDDIKNITEQLKKLVRKRKISIVINKQENSYKLSKSANGRLSSESYTYFPDDE